MSHDTIYKGSNPMMELEATAHITEKTTGQITIGELDFQILALLVNVYQTRQL